MWAHLVQFAASLDAAANLDTAGRLVRKVCAEGGVDDADRLVVLPEAAMVDFGPPDRPLGQVAETLTGAFVTGLADLARAVRATVVAGMFETSADPDRPYNTVVVVSPTGEVVARYRKIHLYDSFGYRESDRLLAGDVEVVTLPWHGLTLGMLTCYDLRFPELGRALVDAGADTLVVPSAWVPGPRKEDHWETLLRARAIENTAYVLGADQAAPAYIGASLAVDPEGVVLGRLGSGEGVATVRIEPGVVSSARRRNSSLTNRRDLGVR